MELSLEGIVHSFEIGLDKGLLPLHEAITNSAQAIEDAKPAGEPGTITITIEREPQIEGIDRDTRSEAPIRNIIIEDNGIGFTQDNFRSFCVGHSTYKFARGGKGIGRFSWLKVFEKVEVDSIFTIENVPHKRSFHFDFSFNGKAVAPPFPSVGAKRKTRISLLQMKNDYQARTVRRLEAIIQRLLRHHYSLFLQPHGPSISLIDDGQSTHLNKIFSDAIGHSEERKRFSVNGEEFSLVGLKYCGPPLGLKHRLVFSGDGREVQSFDLGKDIPALKKSLTDETGATFVFLGIVESSYLDKNLDNERTGFRIPRTSSDGQGNFEYAAAFDDIRKAALAVVKGSLSEYLTDQREALRKRVVKFIKEAQPRYRPLLSELDEILENFDPAEGNSALELFLHQAYNRKVEALRAQGQKLASEEPSAANQEELERFVKEANQVGQSELATYVAYRRWILSLLRKSFQYQDDTNRYAKEKAVHTLICPMRKDSDDLHWEDQNLWVVDERLSFHHFLASDKELRALSSDVFDSDSRLRPDVLLFDTPHVFVEAQDGPQNSVVLLEFKRPSRDDYKFGVNDPIQQVFDQTEAIRNGKYKDADGRKISLTIEKVPFYAYIICDLEESLRKVCRKMNYHATPDNQGYLGYNSGENLYIEIISYDKLLNDAEKRNRVLFDKLQIPRDYFRISSEILECEVEQRDKGETIAQSSSAKAGTQVSPG